MSNKSIYIPNGGDKYIKLSQALEALDSCSCWYAHDRMEMIPAADVVERKHGKWINPRPDLEMCSACGTSFYISALFYVGGNEEPNFCPNCGAKMESGEENG